jgi:hypothetical protein
MNPKKKTLIYVGVAVIVVSVLILYFSFTSPENLHTVSVVSMQTGCFVPLGPMKCNPAGASFKLTVNASSTDVPVTQLSAKLIIVKPNPIFIFRYTIPVDFTFNISQSNPLMPGQTASAIHGTIVGPIDFVYANNTTPLYIEGKLQNGQTFNYEINVMVS